MDLGSQLGPLLLLGIGLLSRLVLQRTARGKQAQQQHTKAQAEGSECHILLSVPGPQRSSMDNMDNMSLP